MAYAGSCLRVRRSSDNAEQDIGFSGNLIDSAALTSFCGAGHGFVVKWYDQSGNGNDFEQTTTANQPVIVSAGVVLAEVLFGAGSRSLFSTNNTGAVPAFSWFFRATLDGTTENILEQSTGFHIQTGAVYYKTALMRLLAGLTQTSQANRSLSEYASGGARQVLGVRLDRAQVTAAAQVAAFSGGTKLTRIANQDLGTLPSGNFVANKWFFGGRNNALTFNDSAGMLVMYEAAISDANMNEISRLLG
jgi:hypothetical protein